MTEPYSAYPETPVYTTESTTSADDDAGRAGAVDTAKDQVGAVAQNAAQAGQQVAATAKDQVQNVAAQAGTQAKDLLAQARSEVADQAGTQQQRLAGGLRSLADELATMAQNSDQPGLATDVARQASEQTRQIASWFDAREPGHVLEEIKSFARQRPGTFLAVAAVAGLVAGRVTRGVKDATSDDSATTTASASTIGRHEPAAGPVAHTPVAPSASSQAGPGGYPTNGELQ